jgi:large subunit ribosomal protein L6
MSRLARKPVTIPSGVTIAEQNHSLTVKGPKGELAVPVLPHVQVQLAANGAMVTTEAKYAQARMNIGTMWSLIQNAIIGVTKGYEKVLEIEGVGYRAAIEGNTLVLSLGYVNPVRYEILKGVAVVVEKNTIKVSGIDKELVGRTASQIRGFKKPEPYKGKGIHYQGEVIKRKVGKKAATVAAV